MEQVLQVPAATKLPRSSAPQWADNIEPNGEVATCANHITDEVAGTSLLPPTPGTGTCTSGTHMLSPAHSDTKRLSQLGTNWRGLSAYKLDKLAS